jgi:hypothetical protein
MSADKFGLGDWWPRPDQAAVGALDRLPAEQWPMLAAKWLAEDSIRHRCVGSRSFKSGDWLGTERTAVPLAEASGGISRSGPASHFPQKPSASCSSTAPLWKR